ncbi:hypothetical protein BVC71_01320 [Marivivens niveibacter]|uniref:Flagellar hook-length control protein-like C-terminal domain-containing protein n=1 Tax=Marivivens niveibacter TaxID=1930667 RepID=A0A251X1B0_9RHOB|nr:flagellar hook-length control protein FliK [Marivivens niveibacter]OUD10185.1 hypothetical protein BVC71_01320 [Marivivens niveibacter]
MEPINIADSKSNSLVPATSGKAGKTNSQTALFDRLMATVAPVGETGESADLLGMPTLGDGLTEFDLADGSPSADGEALPTDMPEILALLESQEAEADIDPALFNRTAANVNLPVKIVAQSTDKPQVIPGAELDIADTGAETTDATDGPATMIPAAIVATPVAAAAAATALSADGTTEITDLENSDAATDQIATTDAAEMQAVQPKQIIESQQQPAQIVAANAQAEATASQTSGTASKPVAGRSAAPSGVAKTPMGAMQAQSTPSENPQPTIGPASQTNSDSETVSDSDSSDAIDVTPAKRRAALRPSHTGAAMTDTTMPTAKFENMLAEATKVQAAQPAQPQNVDASGQPIEQTGLTSETATETQAETATIDTTQEAWMDELANQIEASFTEDGGDIDIALTPENLGGLRIRMEVRDGAAHVTILTDTSEAAKLFNQNEQRLSEMMSKNGLTLTGQDASAGQRRDGNGGQGQGQNGHGFANGQSGDGNDAPAPTVKLSSSLVNLIA